MDQYYSPNSSSLQALFTLLDGAKANVRVAEIAEVAQIAEHNLNIARSKCDTIAQSEGVCNYPGLREDLMELLHRIQSLDQNRT